MNYPLGTAILGFVGGRAPRPGGDRRPGPTTGDGLHPLDGPAFGAGARALMTSCTIRSVTAAQLNLIGSHDTPRARTVLGGDVAALRLATLLQLTLPGAPSIYYGDEIGMDGGHDPDYRRGYPRRDPTSRGDRDCGRSCRATAWPPAGARRRACAAGEGPRGCPRPTAGARTGLREADGRIAACVAINAGAGRRSQLVVARLVDQSGIASTGSSGSPAARPQR